MSTLFLDFEFNRVTDEKVNLVCCHLIDLEKGIEKSFWLHNDSKAKNELSLFLSGYDTLIAYSVVAEARSLISLGLDPMSFKWVDLFLEFRCLTNHNDKLNWGNQLVDGKVKFVKKTKPKWERTEEEESNGFKHTHSLSEAVYKLLKIVIDTDHKNLMRDKIISDPVKFSDSDKHDILKYCKSDVANLPKLWAAMISEYKGLNPEIGTFNGEQEFLEEAYIRGSYSALTAIRESKGYPINYDKVKNFSRSIDSIVYDCQSEINSLFPEIKPFKWDKKESKFKWSQKNTRDWVRSNHDVAKWKKTDNKDVSLSLEAFQDFYDFKHTYPTDNFGAQMVRFLKLKQSLYGFANTGKRKGFFDYVGKDKRVRPYMNIYGAQSSRSQPSAGGFMFLKPAWMRALVEPKPGYAIAGVDYGSEEFLIQALLSGDQGMIDAYLSGDVYLAFAKDAGMVPANGTKEEFKYERDLCKSTVLGLSYLMSEYGLARKLTADTKKPWTEEMALEMIDLFYESYPDLKKYQREVREDYENYGIIKLPCGWYCWGDNDNFRSVTNLGVQGLGASIMRKADILAHERGLYVPFTLHDALYIEYKIGEEYKIKILMDCMREAFMYYFDDKEVASQIKLDPFAWSPGYKKDSEIVLSDGVVVPSSNIYIDERAKAEYEKFSKYFDFREELNL